MIITAGKYKGQKITAPDENITRPTLSKVRMSVFNTLGSMMDFEGKSFLDMFAGSGIMGLEALSRGFESVIAIENHPRAAKIVKDNSQKLLKYCHYEAEPKQSEYQLIIGDSLKICAKSDKKFDVIYIDPPYFSGIYENSLNVIQNITSSIVILEHLSNVDFTGFELIKQKKYGNKYITFLCKTM